MEKIKRLRWLAIAALFCFLSGCSQDDDGYNDSEMFTRAEEGMMRNGEGGDGGSSKKTPIHFEIKKTNSSSPKGVDGKSSPTLFGEHDSSALSISIGNYTGNAILYIYSVQGNHLMDSATKEVANAEGIDFSLAGYPTGKNYQIHVILGSATYVGTMKL